MTSNTSLSDVFEYMGKGQIVPKDVVSVRFHPSVVEVEEEAFEGCSVLKKVVFNVGVKKIGDKAFYNCTNLSEVVFNEGLHTIGRRAFYGTALEIISLPSTLTEIDLYAFSNCKRIREVSLNEKNTNKIDACAFDQSLQRFKFTGISARLENIIQYQPGVGDKIDEVCGTRMRSSDVSSEEEEHDNDGVQHVPQLLADAVMGAADAGEEEVEAVEVPIVDNGALDMELWDLKVVLPIEQINDPFGQQCETTGCRLAACCIWASNWNPTTPWYTCLDCQEKDFEGWPENRDIPLRVMSSSLRNVMIERSSRYHAPIVPMPNLPTGDEITAERDSNSTENVMSGVERKGSGIFVSPGGGSTLDRISKVITHYEMKEGTVLFELALWKAMVCQSGGTSPANRSACRIEVPGPVKDTILQYLPF